MFAWTEWTASVLSTDIFSISPPFPPGLSQCDHWKNRIKRHNPKPKTKNGRRLYYLKWPRCERGCVCYTHLYLLVSPERVIVDGFMICKDVCHIGSGGNQISALEKKGFSFSHCLYLFLSFSDFMSVLSFFVSVSFLPWTEAHSHIITAKLWMQWCPMLYGVLNTVYLSEIKAPLSSIVFCSVLA